MKLKIKASKLMSKNKSVLGSMEDRLIRIPAGLREELNIRTGSFLRLKQKGGREAVLQVMISYLEDALEDEMQAYVSKDTHNLLKLSKISLVDPADDILVGCDPEFFLVDLKTGRTRPASHFFPYVGKLGSDCGLAELRPRPAYYEKDLTANLLELMDKAYKRIADRVLYRKEDLAMIAASHLNEASAGFHIHFGLPSILLDESDISGKLLKNMSYILDYYVGIPAIMPEGSEDCRRRVSGYSQYGKPGDVRADRITLEYRVPGGHLLRHPVLTAGLLGIGVVVMKDMLSRIKLYSNEYRNKNIFYEYDQLRDLYPNLPDRVEIYKSIVSPDTKNAIRHLDNIVDDLSKMIGFSENSEAVLNYFKYVLSYIRGEKKFGGNLAINWRLFDEKQPEQVAFLQSAF